MPNPKSDLGWLLAVVLAGTTALFAWQYARARGDANILRHEYDALQQRVTEQDRLNTELRSSLDALTAQLNQAQRRIEALAEAVEKFKPSPSEP